MNEWSNEWMNEWMNKWMNEWMNEWMYFSSELSTSYVHNIITIFFKVEQKVAR